MGSVLFRNRYWWYRSLYDDYVARESKLAFQLSDFIQAQNDHFYPSKTIFDLIIHFFFIQYQGIASFIWLPHYYWGIHLNRAFEVGFSHRNYAHEWGPRRNRLTHSLEFEQFDMVLENWLDLEDEYGMRGEAMLKL